MRSIEEIRSLLYSGSFELSDHCIERVTQRYIDQEEIRQAGQHAILVEDYPDDNYSPSCLLLGFTKTGRPLHIQVSLAETELVRIVTVYEPNPNYWIDCSTRRRP